MCLEWDGFGKYGYVGLGRWNRKERRKLVEKREKMGGDDLEGGLGR